MLEYSPAKNVLSLKFAADGIGFLNHHGEFHGAPVGLN